MFFVIADLSGYTALTEAHGGEGAAATVARYRELAQRALAEGARIAEQVGDELLIVADDARGALLSAVRIRDAVEAEPRFPGVRIAVHGGPAIERDGHFFGAALNLTARLAARARAGEIVCSVAVAAACSDLGGVSFHGLGPRRFKNVPEPVEVVSVVSPVASERATALDPVCRMRLEPDAAPARLPFRGTTYVFCSLECAHAFAASPENYVPV
jgi:class 3 adenylate cyclase/YHS domain-containing protein